LSFYLLSFAEGNATIRYVSKTGLSIPPYISWDNAADSIQKCINVCVFGDTIYVANGVYEEQVIMIPGLSLIGAGTDSCLIDTRDLVTSQEFVSVEVKDSCLLKGFNILVYHNTDWGWGIGGGGGCTSLVTLNKVTNANIGVLLDATWFDTTADITIYKNILENVHDGIELFNSNSLVRGNVVYTDLQYRGINIGAFTHDYTPHIDSNYIVAGEQGIIMVFGTKATISNNRIFLKGESSYGIFGGNPDTSWVHNNLIVAEDEVWYGLTNVMDPTFNCNNFLIGNFNSEGISATDYNVIINNTVINSPKGIIVSSGQNPPVVQYNNSWNNTVNYGGFTPDSTNLSVDPMIVNGDSTQVELDFHLQMYSPLIDTGDPNILDKDSSRSDISLYGGPFGESYLYLDLPPRAPRNLTAEVDSINNLIVLSWNSSTENDFNFYNLYRDTKTNFEIDTTKLISSQADTFYVEAIPLGAKRLVYKITATDNQGNESLPSEEVVIDFVSAVNNPPVVINNYMLYLNYPNPFNPSTKIGYKLRERGYVKLYVYSITGELVSVLVNQTQEAGYYEVEFNASVGSGQSAIGNQFASGVYIYQIMIRNENNIPVFTDIKKMLMIK
jgi:hypothetical protein